MNWESWKGRARQIKARAAQAKAGAAGRAKKICLPGWQIGRASCRERV